MIYSKVKTLKFSLQLLTLFAVALTSVSLLHCTVINKRALVRALAEEARLIQSVPTQLSKINQLMGKISIIHMHDVESAGRTEDLMDAFPSRYDTYGEEEGHGADNFSSTRDSECHTFYEYTVAESKKLASEGKIRGLERGIYQALDRSHARVKIIFKMFIMSHRLQLIKAGDITRSDLAEPLGTLSKEKSFVKKLRSYVRDTIYDKSILSKRYIDLLNPEWLDEWVYPWKYPTLTTGNTPSLCDEELEGVKIFESPETAAVVFDTHLLDSIDAARKKSKDDLDSAATDASDLAKILVDTLQTKTEQNLKEFIANYLIKNKVTGRVPGESGNQFSYEKEIVWFEKYCTSRLPCQINIKLDKKDRENFSNLLRRGRLTEPNKRGRSSKSHWWEFFCCSCSKRRRR